MRPAFYASGLCAFAAVVVPSVTAASDEAELESVRKKSVTQGRVCPDPARPCGTDFRSHELSFEISTKFAFDRGEDRSRSFYAVILESGKLCAIPEPRRLEVQALFPARKVFLHRYFCEDFGDNVGYTNVDRKTGFIAVYAGGTEAESRKVLSEVKALARFPGANLRKMQVFVTYQLE